MNDGNYLQKAGLLGVLHTAKCSWGMDKANEPNAGSVESLQHVLCADTEGCCGLPKAVWGAWSFAN